MAHPFLHLLHLRLLYRGRYAFHRSVMVHSGADRESFGDGMAVGDGQLARPAVSLDRDTRGPLEQEAGVCSDGLDPGRSRLSGADGVLSGCAAAVDALCGRVSRLVDGTVPSALVRQPAPAVIS